MADKYQVHHRGFLVNIRRVTATKNGVRYGGWEIRDYSTGKLVRHQRATLEEAKAKAKEVCECLATGKREVLEWDEHQRFSIRQALRFLEPTKITIDRACAIVAEAAKIIPVEEIVAACRAWHDKRPNRRLVPKRVGEAVTEFLNRRSAQVSQRRYRTDRCYLGMFQKQFTNRWLHEVSTLEVKDWVRSKGWSPKTKNDAIGLVRILYSDAIERGYAVDNPAKIKREPLGDTDVGIFTPGQVQRILNAVEDRLKPFFALLFFSGLRKEEASRLSVAQVREGLRSGSIYLNSAIAKTNRNRAITLPDNLKVWLTQYLPPDGPLLPNDWQSMERLDELGSYAERKSGVKWVYNGPRHSFGTYHLRLFGDPAETVRQMGNSLVQLDRHYSSRADSVTPEAAKAYFTIVPSPCGEAAPFDAARAA